VDVVLGRLKRAYGSYLACKGWHYVKCRVWCQLVLWNRVQLLRIEGGDSFVLGLVVVWVWWLEGEFSNTLRGVVDPIVLMDEEFAAHDGGLFRFDGAIALLSKQVAHAVGKGEAGFHGEPATRLERDGCLLHQLAIGT
jgi:hypothetical protein